jgi:prepilin-type N-terminal cleavage/methylation domain-containing protein
MMRTEQWGIRRPARGFALVEIMIVIAIMGMITAIMMPNVIRAREDSQGTLCTEWLSRIAGAKAQIAFAESVAMSATPHDSVLLAYLEPHLTATAIDGSTDICPAGGVYDVNNFNTDPTCSLALRPGEHELQ